MNERQQLSYYKSYYHKGLDTYFAGSRGIESEYHITHKSSPNWWSLERFGHGQLGKRYGCRLTTSMRCANRRVPCQGTWCFMPNWFYQVDGLKIRTHGESGHVHIAAVNTHMAPVKMARSMGEGLLTAIG